jgi:hypothetical protein
VDDDDEGMKCRSRDAEGICLGKEAIVVGGRSRSIVCMYVCL